MKNVGAAKGQAFDHTQRGIPLMAAGRFLLKAPNLGSNSPLYAS